MNWPRILGVCFVVGLAGIAIGMPVAGAEPNVQIEATAVDAEYLTTEDAITIDVTVSNLESSTDPVDISSLYIRGEGTAKTYDRLGDVSTIDPGGSVTVPLSVTFDDPGEHRLTVHMVASSDGGGSESYEYPLLVDVEASDVTAELTVTGADDLGQTNVTLTNFGNREISRAEIVARVNDTVVDRHSVFDLAPETKQTALFDTRAVAREIVTFEATYRANEQTYTTRRTVNLRERTQVPGQVRLTSVTTTPTATGLRIEGDAANLGNTDIESVLVAIPERDTVGPTAPFGDYFVGEIERSEFATFELTAQTRANVSSVPVRIAYIVDNVERQAIQTVAVDSPSGGGTSLEQPAAVAESKDDGGGGVPLVLLVGSVVVIGIVGAGVYRRYRQ